GAEGVSRRRITLGLLEAEVLVLPGTVEDGIARTHAKHRCELGTADAVRLEVAEHLVCLTGHGMAGHAVRLAEEEQRAALLAGGHGVPVAAGEAIQRRVRGGECGLELGKGASAHTDRNTTGRERDTAVEDLPELFSILGTRIQSRIDSML